jgi:cell division septum initiation protein DivIVA/molecular chaperone GrpE (heat shock protein)
MAEPRILKLGILADTSDLVKGLKNAEGAVNDSGSRIGEGFKKVGVAVAAAGAAIGTFAIALGKQSIQAAIQAESEQNRLATILRTTGATEKEIQVLDQQAQALERVGVVSGGNIKVLQSQLATFDLSAGAIQRLTPAILDYVTAEKGAAASADDFKSMTNGLAQALNGNFASLTKTGFVLDENTKEMIKNGTETERAEALVQVLNSTYKGFNETLAETSEGRLIQLRNNFDQIKERIGNVLLPVLQQLTEFFVQKILPVIDNLVARFEKDANPAISKMKEVIVDFVLPALKNLWAFLTDYFFPTIKNLLTPVIDILRKAFEFLSSKVQENKQAFETAIAIMLNIFAFVRDNLAPILGNVLATAFNIITRAIGLAIDNFGKVFAIIEKVARFLGFDLDLALGQATQKMNKNTEATANAYRQFNELNKQTKDETIPSLLSATDATNSLSSSTNKLAGASKAATEALKEQFTAAQALDLIRSGFGSAVGTQSTGALAGGETFRSAAELVSRFGGLVPGFNQLPTDPFFGFGQGADIRTFKPRQNIGANNVTINVNGTVIDPEGAARAIEQIINESNARGGALFTDLLGINP